jgi:hypothetical protein
MTGAGPGSDAASRGEECRDIRIRNANGASQACTGRAPESISRRTVRGDTFKSSAVSSMVRSLVTGRTRMVEVISTARFEAGRCAGLKVRSVVPAPSSTLCLFPARAATFRPLERRRDTRRPSRLHARSSRGPRLLDDAGGRACGADLHLMVETNWGSWTWRRPAGRARGRAERGTLALRGRTVKVTAALAPGVMGSVCDCGKTAFKFNERGWGCLCTQLVVLALVTHFSRDRQDFSKTPTGFGPQAGD